MTVPRLKEMNAYWKQHPPLHLMVAHYLGAGEKKTTEVKSTKTQEDRNQEMGEMLMSMFPMRG